MTATAYPLAWPDGWPRSNSKTDGRSTFGKTRESGYGKRPLTLAEARDSLGRVLDRLGAAGVVLSTNFELRLDGQPRAGGRIPDDQGVAVYFMRKGRQVVIACDRYTRAAENMRSIALGLEALATLERHGGGVMLDRAFEGFLALPSAEKRRRPWWEVLRYMDREPDRSTLDEELIGMLYRRAAKGATEAELVEINLAKEDALAWLKAKATLLA